MPRRFLSRAILGELCSLHTSVIGVTLDIDSDKEMLSSVDVNSEHVTLRLPTYELDPRSCAL